MLNLLRRLLTKLKRQPAELPPSLLAPEDEHTLQLGVEAVLAPVEPVVTKPKPKGRVIKQTRHAEFNPNPSRSGGRIVKVMPRQLQKMRAAQEKVENDETPNVEDIEE